MEFDCFECVAKHEFECFSQVTAIGKRRSDKITKISAAERSMEDLMQHDRANNRLILIAANKKTNGLRSPDTGEKSNKLFLSFWW
jgi:hypothetical protein